MRYGKVPGIEKKLSRLVQGTVMVHSAKLAESFALLDDVFSAGCSALDTARSYNEGDTEHVVGRWLQERGHQGEVVIISKGAHHNQERKRVTPRDITADLNESLACLGLETIDLYLLHRDDPSVSVGPIVEVLNEHHAAGRISAFGGSNWSHDRIREANEYADAHGLVRFAASSPQFSLAEQITEPWPDCVSISGPDDNASRKWYQQNQLPLFAWSSLAGGFFSGRFRRNNLDSFERDWDRLCVSGYASEYNFKRLDRAARMAVEKGLTLPQVAMAYVFNQPMNVFAVVGCRGGSEFAENVKGSKVVLTESEMAWLEYGGEHGLDERPERSF
jgi:aryl-alcohol dehydrogenase-like predicted oxidoreductase